MDHLWILSLCLVFVLLRVDCKSTRKPPEELTDAQGKYLECYMTLPWQTMTLEIVKDVQLKVNQANSIQEKYKRTLAYELGTIAAGIQETFEHMLEMYRTYANLHDFKNRTHNLTVTMNAYHVIQGDYNKIRLENLLFRQVKDKFEAKRKAELKRLKQMGVDVDKFPKGTPNPKDIPELKAFAASQMGGSEEFSWGRERRFGIESNGLPWKITTTTTKRRLWGSAPVDFINIT